MIDKKNDCLNRIEKIDLEEHGSLNTHLKEERMKIKTELLDIMVKEQRSLDRSVN